MDNVPLDTLEDLGITMGINVCASLAIIFAFSLIRCCQKEPDLTEPRMGLLEEHRRYSDQNQQRLDREENQQNAHPAFQEEVARPTTNIFGWIRVLSSISDQEVLTRCHKDGFLYLLFLRYMYIYFFFLTLGSCGILIPIFLINKEKNFDKLATYSVASILNENWKMWIVLGFTMVYSLMAFALLYILHHRIQNISVQEYSNMQDSLAASRTLQIKGLPPTFSGRAAEQKLQKFLDEALGGSNIISTRIMLDYRNVYSILLRIKAVKEKLENVIQSNTENEERETIRKGICCCKTYEDAEVYYLSELDKLQKEEQKELEGEGIKRGIGTAFVMFSEPLMLPRVVHAVRRRLPNSPRYQLLDLESWRIDYAPAPNDILWQNLGIGAIQRVFRTIIFNALLILVCVIIVTPITLTSQFNNIMKMLNSRIGIVQEMYSFTLYTFGNYVPPLLLYVNNFLIIPFMIYIATSNEGKEKKSSVEQSILAKNILFMILDTIVVPSLGIDTIYSLLLHREQMLNFPARILVATPTFSKYLIQIAFISNGLQLLALPQLIINRLRECINNIFSSDQKDFTKWYFSLGASGAFVITIFCLLLIYSTTAPWLTLIGMLYFYFKYFVDKYNMLYVYPIEFESNGMTVESLIRYTLIGICLFNFVTISTISASGDKYLQLASFLEAILLVACCFLAYFYLVRNEESRWLNRILGLNVVEVINRDGSFSPRILPIAQSPDEVKELIKNAYNHPCDSVNPELLPLLIPEEVKLDHEPRGQFSPIHFMPKL